MSQSRDWLLTQAYARHRRKIISPNFSHLKFSHHFQTLIIPWKQRAPPESELSPLKMPRQTSVSSKQGFSVSSVVGHETWRLGWQAQLRRSLWSCCWKHTTGHTKMLKMSLDLMLWELNSTQLLCLNQIHKFLVI